MALSRTYDEPRAGRRICDELFAIWAAERAEANLAYAAWCAARGPDSYAVYRAAEDRADAAERDYQEACTGLLQLA